MKIAYIAWLDAYHLEGRQPIEVTKEDGFIILTAGILLRNDKNSVAVSRDLYSNGDIEDPIVIPRSYIKEIKVFETSKKHKKRFKS